MQALKRVAARIGGMFDGLSRAMALVEINAGGRDIFGQTVEKALARADGQSHGFIVHDPGVAGGSSTDNGSNRGATLAITGTTAQSQYNTWSFVGATTTQWVYLHGVWPHDYGGEAVAHVIWSASTTTSAVSWEVLGRSISCNDAAARDAALTSWAATTGAPGTTADQLVTTRIAATAAQAAQARPGRAYVIAVRRDPTAAGDTMTEVALIHHVVISYVKKL